MARQVWGNPGDWNSGDAGTDAGKPDPEREETEPDK